MSNVEKQVPIDKETKVMLIMVLQRGYFEQAEIDMINSKYTVNPRLTQEQLDKFIEKL